MSHHKPIAEGLILTFGVFLILVLITERNGKHKDFHIVFTRNIPGVSDTLDTSEGTYTREFPEEGSFCMELSNEEREEIYSKIAEMNVFDYTSNFSNICEPTAVMSKTSQYHFIAENNFNTKEMEFKTGVQYSGKCQDAHEDLKKLVRTLWTSFGHERSTSNYLIQLCCLR